jgi:HD-GYP domain-containing protein (c-di-GMP phosphodiesterase class II)
MIQKVKSADLKVGMYVMLGASWLRHSFIKPNFLINSDKQIRKIIADGIKTVKVDTSKSKVVEERDMLKDLVGETKAAPEGYEQRSHFEPPEEFNPINQISEALHETIANTRIPPQTKAKAVYDHSIKMVQNVLEKPNRENILAGKKMIYDIVDHILADEETASHMALITSHDYYTYTHSVNVGMLSVLLAKRVFGTTASDHDMKELGSGFFLHDVGKCDMPMELINKPGRQEEHEWRMMRNHPSKGNQILTDTHTLSREVGIIVMQHHERHDGTGYPFGLKGNEIHMYARICSIADVFDALTSTRAYKRKLPTFEALKVMREEMLHHFSPDVFKEFVLIFMA